MPRTRKGGVRTHRKPVTSRTLSAKVAVATSDRTDRHKRAKVGGDEFDEATDVDEDSTGEHDSDDNAAVDGDDTDGDDDSEDDDSEDEDSSDDSSGSDGAEDSAAKRQARSEKLVRRRKFLNTATRTRGDGMFHARFVSVGEGDCIVMSTPDGTLVMVDCGSRNPDGIGRENQIQVIRDAVLTQPFIVPGLRPEIDVLVISHTDKDHCNAFKHVLDDPNIHFRRMYHTAALNDLGKFGHDTKQWLQDRVDFAPGTAGTRDRFSLITKVVHNKESATVGSISLEAKSSGSGRNLPVDLDPEPPKGSPPRLAPAAAAVGIDELDADGGIRIVAEDRCRITILAAGVQMTYADESDPDEPSAGTKRKLETANANRECIVLLVELIGPKGTSRAGLVTKKLLLCGDATKSTEAYILAEGKYAKAPYKGRMKQRVTGVTAAQIGHHGSFTSSSADWVDTLKAPTAVCSAASDKGRNEYRLPRKAVIDTWIEEASAGQSLRSYAWEKGKSEITRWRYTKDVRITGSHGTVDLDWAP